MSVYQVVTDGLPTEFPVLRSVDYFTGNLPQQLSSLVGRESVVSEIAELARASATPFGDVLTRPFRSVLPSEISGPCRFRGAR